MSFAEMADPCAPPAPACGSQYRILGGNRSATDATGAFYVNGETIGKRKTAKQNKTKNDRAAHLKLPNMMQGRGRYLCDLCIFKKRRR
eukprot:SAG11_NODE_987_length_6278_cov_10.303447_5_plen_88_part_00